jgi:hypothetical protein
MMRLVVRPLSTVARPALTAPLPRAPPAGARAPSNGPPPAPPVAPVRMAAAWRESVGARSGAIDRRGTAMPVTTGAPDRSTNPARVDTGTAVSATTCSLTQVLCLK